MGLADLIAALEADVEGKAAQEREAGRREVQRIREMSELRLADQRADLLTRHAATRRRVLAAEIADTEIAIRAGVLEARERVLADVFERVRDSLPDLQASETYRRGLAVELADALSYVEGADDVVIRCAPSLLSALRPLLVVHAGARLEADDSILAGFRVYANGGRIEVDGTLESRLRRLAPLFRIDIVRHLEAVVEGTPGDATHALG